MVDAVRLRALLSRLRSRRHELERYATLEVEEYLAEPERIHASKYLLITAIEDALAVANHIISAEGLRAPADYADAFRSLSEADVLDSELARRLEGMARFRNLLVHGYARVDDRRVHGFLLEDVGDLDRFSAQVLAAFPELSQ